MAELTGGRAITIYGQNEVVRDLIDARRAIRRAAPFDVSDLTLHDLRDRSAAGPLRGGRRSARTDAATVVAGCDGFHGASPGRDPGGRLRTFERIYPFAWLGILADAAADVRRARLQPARLAASRSSACDRRAITRLYLQFAPDEDLAHWPDDRIWTELRTRLHTSDGWEPREGPILQKGMTGMRSFVAEPMRYGRLFLAGDAAHIVPPTGAKGLNLAMADVARLAAALRRSTGMARPVPLDALFRARAAARLARAALLLVDDVDAAPPRAATARSTTGGRLPNSTTLSVPMPR